MSGSTLPPAPEGASPPGAVPPRTVAEALLAAAADPRGRREGLRFVDRRERVLHLTWTEVAARAHRVAAELRGLGVEKSDAVPLVYGTTPEFFDGFFGATLLGAIPVPLYPPLRLGRTEEYAQRTSRLISATGARFVLVASALRERLRPIARSAGARLIDLAEAGSRRGGVLVEGLPAAGRDPVEIPTDPEALGLIQFSSGSTGDPRPVALSHRALLAQTELIEELLPDDPARGLRQSGVSWLPLYHDMGLIGCVLPALSRPTDLTLFAPELFVARPALWLRTLSRYRASVSAAPNFAFAMCLERIDVDGPELEGVDLSAWHAALVGAETVVPSVLHRFSERFARFGFAAEALTPVYGLAEAALAVTATPIARPFETLELDRDELVEQSMATVASSTEEALELVALGRPLPGFEVEIRSRDEEPASPSPTLPDGAVGRVFCRGPSLMNGYLGQPEATARVLSDGWLDTGDLGFLREGELFLTGRAKDVLVVRGRNYSPEPIEVAVCEVEGIGAVVATSLAESAEGSEHLVLLVERRSKGLPATQDRELARQCRRRALTGSGLVAAAVVLLEPGYLPRTSSGKLRRGEALRRYREGRLPDPIEVVFAREPASEKVVR